MDWKSHMLAGLVLTVFSIYLFLAPSLLDLAILSIFGAFAALVPDLDHHASKGRAALDVSFILVSFSFAYLGGCGNSFCIPSLSIIGGIITTFFAFLGIYLFFFTFLKPPHRGITHTILACFVFSIFLFFVLGMKFALAGFVGYISHLFADFHIELY